MTRSILLFALLALTLTACETYTADAALSTEKEVYTRAISFGDIDAARMSVYRILELAPEERSWKDTLISLHLERQNLASAILVTQDRIKDEDANDTLMYQIQAAGFNSLQQYGKAAEMYANLYELTKDPSYKYQQMGMLTQNRQVEEAMIEARNLLEMEEAQSMRVRVSYEDNAQAVPMIAAVYNVMGILQLQQRNQTVAREHFAKALEIAPEFQLAQENMKLELQ